MSYLISLLEGILGDCRKHSEYKGQTSFDCPCCDHGRHKGNLEVNYKLGVFKCWSCKDINNMYGSLYQLIKRFGNKTDLDTFKLIKPDYDYDNFASLKPKFLELPKELKKIHGDLSKEAISVKNYLNNRNISDEMIEEFQIMYSTAKGFRSRAIIPSFDENGDIEYYVSRATFDKLSPKYKNPDYDKDNIIFFEQRINWEANIYLVEGIFDALVIPNAIPMLGKYASQKLVSKLMEKAKANVIIILDGDAIDDAKILYQNLDVLNLSGRVRLIEILADTDLSEINKVYGRKAIIDTLKHAKRM